jgi:hypothetical protein
VAVGTFLAVIAVVAAVAVLYVPGVGTSPEQVAAEHRAGAGGSSGEESPSDSADPSAEGSTDAATDGPGGGDGTGASTGAAGAPVVTGGRPVAAPPVASSSKKVFAHYFPPYPVSFDNADPSRDYYARNYLTVDGESGKHAEYGGLLRDRPASRAPLSGDWRAKDFQSEVQAAVAAGIDGFTINIMSLAGDNWTRTVGVTRAAEASGRGFVIVPNVDANGSVGNASATTVAAKLADLLRSPAAYRLPDGRPVLSSFKAEGKDPSWWRDILSHLRNDHGLNVAFIAVFLNANSTNMQRFSDFSHGFGNWGVRTPRSIDNAANYAATAHNLGKVWMQPVAVQDVRPNQYKYAEAGNTEALRASWNKAIRDGADLVQMVTWNDYSEGTQFAPSAAHGRVFLDITTYYVHQFKTGSAPAIASDALFVTHRIQPYGAQPTTAHGLMQPTLEGSSATQPRDTVEALVMLTAPARVTVTIGGRVESFDAPAGVSARTFPLGQGTISATVERSGGVVVGVTSPFPVVARPDVQDLQYYAVSSVRG